MIRGDIPHHQGPRSHIDGWNGDISRLRLRIPINPSVRSTVQSNTGNLAVP